LSGIMCKAGLGGGLSERPLSATWRRTMWSLTSSAYGAKSGCSPNASAAGFDPEPNFGRFARRVDNTQAECAEFCRSLGLRVQTGKDDLLVSDGQKMVQVELKSPEGKLTEGQRKLRQLLPGCYIVVRNPYEIYNWFKYGRTTVEDAKDSG